MILRVLGLLLLFTWSATAQCDDVANQCFDATCGIEVQGNNVDTPCSCTEDDQSYLYTNCRDDGTRHILWYWKPPATCHVENVTLSNPITGIPCGMSCRPGSYLDVTTAPYTCTPCPTGTVSLGGGAAFGPPWRVIPAQFVSECIGSSAVCNPWTFRENYIDSGDNFDGADLQSLLTLQFTLVVPGYLSFTYKYDAEELFETFLLSVDGTVVLWRNKPVTDWKTFKMQLKPGHHLARWFYNKDISTSEGADRAFIRNVEIAGMSYADLECTPCPPGYITKGNHSHCAPCPVNTFNDAYGASQCKPCAGGEVAFAGSAACVPNLPCNASDIATYRSACVVATSNTGGAQPGIQTVTYDWIQPPACITLSGVPLPGPTTQACVANPRTCAPGTQPLMTELGVNEYAFTCQACPSGMASPGGGVPCVPCPEGEGAQAYMLFVTDFPADMLTSTVNGVDWSTVCVGEACHSATAKGEGWRPAGYMIDSGSGHAPGTSVALQLHVGLEHRSEEVVYHPIEISFNYSLSCASYAASMEVSVDEILVAVFYCDDYTDDGCDTTVRRESIIIPDSLINYEETEVSSHVIAWKYVKEAAPLVPNECDMAKLFAITVDGVLTEAHSGATVCAICVPGFHSEGGDHICRACPAGKFSNHATQGCQQCAGETISYLNAQSTCLSCGARTQALPTHTACNGHCALSLTGAGSGGSAYDIDLKPIMRTPLSNLSLVLGPIPSALNYSWVYYVSLCAPIPSPDDPWLASSQMHVARLCGKLETDGWTDVAGLNYVGTVPPAGGARVCLTDGASSSFNLGTLEGYEVDPAFSTGNITEVGFNVTLSGGASRCSQNELDFYRRAQTTIHFKCDVSAGAGSPVDITPNSDLWDICATHFEWRSIYACPMCTSASYSHAISACGDEGKAVKKYFWKEPKQCNGGVALPGDELTDCVRPYVEDYQLSTPQVAGIVFVVLAIFLAAICAVCVLLRKNRRLNDRYSQLLLANRSDGEDQEWGHRGGSRVDTAERPRSGGSSDDTRGDMEPVELSLTK